MLRLIHPVMFIVPVLLVVLFSRTECSRRDNLSIHVTLRETNCSLPCKRVDNGTCVNDCPPRSYCDSYFRFCVECQKHCNICMSSTFCSVCDDNLQPVAGGGCVKLCEPGYYRSPYATQCLACPQHCLNCSGLNQCQNCSDNYILYDEIARQVCIMNCTNGSFYNQTSDQCQACAEHCKNCEPTLGCIECEDQYVISNNLCLLATPTVTTSASNVATPTTSMQSTVSLTSTATATPTTTVQPKESNKDTIYYILGGAGGAAIVIVILTIVIVIVACYRKKSKVDFRPLLQFGEDDSDDDDEELEEEDYSNNNNSGSVL